jgi:hypothetical protein
MASYNYGKITYRKLNSLCTPACSTGLTSNTKFLSIHHEGYLRPCEPDIPAHLYTYKTDPRFPTRIVNYIGKDTQPDGLNADIDGFPVYVYRKSADPVVIRQ